MKKNYLFEVNYFNVFRQTEENRKFLKICEDTLLSSAFKDFQVWYSCLNGVKNPTFKCFEVTETVQLF